MVKNKAVFGGSFNENGLYSSGLFFRTWIEKVWAFLICTVQN